MFKRRFTQNNVKQMLTFKPTFNFKRPYYHQACKITISVGAVSGAASCAGIWTLLVCDNGAPSKPYTDIRNVFLNIYIGFIATGCGACVGALIGGLFFVSGPILIPLAVIAHNKSDE
jgi:hypothetical protein